MSAPLAELRNVERRFRVGGGLLRGARDLRAVDRVSLAVGRGEVLGIVGESGCGKSTLARLLLGLLRPSAGEIFVDGRPIGSFGARALARRLQPVFQDPYSSLNPRHSIGAIIAAPLIVHRIGNAKTRRTEVERLMHLVGLPQRLYDTYPGELSGGQRQRVAIARALVMRPAMVICDEPTSALDVSVQSQILNLLADLQQEFGLTYILISHNLAVVEHMATRVAVMAASSRRMRLRRCSARRAIPTPRRCLPPCSRPSPAVVSRIPALALRFRTRSSRRPAAPSIRAARRPDRGAG